MKKAIVIMLMLTACLSINAQDIQLSEAGAYVKKEVFKIESSTAAVLFGRAMEALSDWTGPDGKAKAGIDYQDKETGTVIYKGTFSLGYKKTFLGDGWYRYANFTLKVRCKDGRAQVTVTVPSITAVNSKRGNQVENSTAVLLDAVQKSTGAKHERGVKLMEDLTTTADGLVAAMGERLKTGNADEDF